MASDTSVEVPKITGYTVLNTQKDTAIHCPKVIAYAVIFTPPPRLITMNSM